MKWTIQSLREVGAFQWSILVLYGFSSLPWAWGNIGIILIAPKIPHWCQDYSPSFQNLTSEQQRQIMSSSEVCQRPDVNFTNLSSDELLTFNFSAVAWIDCDQGVSYDHSEFDYTATEQYNLGCGNEWMISMANTVWMFGFFLAAATSGAIADRFGRKTVMVGSGVLGGGAHLLASLAPPFTVFATGRFMAAMSVIAGYTGTTILSMELLRKNQRELTGVVLVFVGVISNTCFGAMAMVVRNHQHIQAIISAFYMLGAVANFCYMPESPRWLASQHRLDEARAVVQRIATFNKESPDQLQHLLPADELQPEKIESEGRKTNILDLFRTPTLRKRTIILCAMWFNLILVGYALLFSLGDFGPDVRTSIMISAVLDLPALTLVMATVDRFGRQVSAFSYMLLAGICCFAMAPLVGATGSPLLLTFALLGKLFSGIQFLIIYIYTPELYPTVIRTMGLGTSSTVARVAGMLAPQITLLNRYWAPCMVVTLGTAGFISALLTPFLPDTTGHELPQLLKEGENFQADHRYRLVLPPDFKACKCAPKSEEVQTSRELKVMANDTSV